MNARYLSYTLLAGSIGVLYGWSGTFEPDCVYTTEVFAQMRFCGPEWTGPDNKLMWTLPVISLGLLVSGLLFLLLDKHGKSNNNQQDSKEK